MERGEGERLHAQRRRRFWTILAALAGFGALAGFVTGYMAGFTEAENDGVDPALLTLGAVGIVLSVLGAAYGSWRFFASADELEVADNLWASLIGFYVYALLFPSWWALSMLHRAQEPDQWAIFAAAMASATAAYLYRKWSNR